MSMYEENSNRFMKNIITDKNYDILSNDESDSINSANIVNCTSSIRISTQTDMSIVSGSIMLELKRLLLRCVDDDKKNMFNIFGHEILNNNAIFTTDHCVSYIIMSRNDFDNLYSSIINYNIDALLDLFKIDINKKEVIKLKLFIDYFIETFTGLRK